MFYIAIVSHYGTTCSTNFLINSLFICLMVIAHSNNFEELSGWTVFSEKIMMLSLTLLYFLKYVF